MYCDLYQLLPAGMVPYEIRVKAINMAGCGEEQYSYCFTQEGGMYIRVLTLILCVKKYGVCNLIPLITIAKQSNYYVYTLGHN